MEKLRHLLQKRAEEQNFRTLPGSPKGIDFYSNDYLGFSHNKELQNIVEHAYNQLSPKYGTGATGSRLISGNYALYESLEPMLANFLSGETALIFASGYMANLGVFSSLPQRGDTILYDELCHACIKDGIRLSAANRFPFKHNDLNDLCKKLQKATGNVYIAVESIYSMDGDQAPVKELAQLAREQSLYLIVDEAHATGVVGAKGEGLCVALEAHPNVFVRIHTFSKALGSHGAVVIAPSLVHKFLVNFCRPFIYTTGLPLHTLVSIKHHIEYLIQHPELISHIHNLIQVYKRIATSMSLSATQSTIQTVSIPDNAKCTKIADLCSQNGYLTKAVRSPTVRPGTERLRICLHTFNSESEINNLLELITLQLNH